MQYSAEKIGEKNHVKKYMPHIVNLEPAPIT